jgi:N-acetyl-anhydromuramyl-L-alanine amidase AmpD
MYPYRRTYNMVNIIQTPSPNFNDVICDKKAIVIHWTAGNYEGSLSWLTSLISKVSANFLLDKTGIQCNELVDIKKRAWHCGGSWHPLLNVDTNAATVGIECEGPPSVIGTSGWYPQMIDSLVWLCKYIVQQIPGIIAVTDHSTINPLYKSDVKCGIGKDLFPWNDFINKVGLIDYSTLEYANEIRKHFGMALLPVPSIQTSTGSMNTSTGVIK